MTRMTTPAFLASIVLSLAACAAEPTPGTSAPSTSSSSTSTGTASPGAFRAGTLIKVDALPLLPSPTKVRYDGYPGSSFLLGIITDDAGWQAFAASAGLRDVPALKPGQMAVYAILDARTNALAPIDYTVGDDGAATFTVRWDRIEPAYVGRTPAAIALVDRGAAKTIAFRSTDGDAIGAYTLP